MDFSLLNPSEFFADPKNGDGRNNKPPAIVSGSLSQTRPDGILLGYFVCRGFSRTCRSGAAVDGGRKAGQSAKKIRGNLQGGHSDLAGVSRLLPAADYHGQKMH